MSKRRNVDEILPHNKRQRQITANENYVLKARQLTNEEITNIVISSNLSVSSLIPEILQHIIENLKQIVIVPEAIPDLARQIMDISSRIPFKLSTPETIAPITCLMKLNARSCAANYGCII
ncbi:Hypothetical protein HVR_LOCUS1132 [uncultured virus]|nr:Hypothetical protein HVR_LOCUS1132 [uncultured virus]